MAHESIQSMAGRGDVDTLRLSLAEALGEAAATGNTACVEVLCSAKFDVNALFGAGSPYEGWTALHLAARKGHSDCVLALLQVITDVDPRSPKHGMTPLMFAAQGGHTQCVVHLLSHGANVDAICTRYQGTALSYAAVRCTVEVFSNKENPIENLVEVVRVLVAAGADTEIADSGNSRPLHFAAFADDPSCVLALIDGGADIEASTAAGQTPLQVAAMKDTSMRSLVMLLRKGARMKFPAVTEHNVKIRTYLRMVSAAGGVSAYDLRRATSFANTLRPFHSRLPRALILSISTFL